MKKILPALLLILAIASSLLAGTIAFYTTSVDIAAGSVTAKEFIFLGDDSQSFTHNASIAPSETVDWSFTVKNYEDSLITETDQYYKLIFSVTGAEGKKPIEPLVVEVVDGAGKVRNSFTGPGNFEILDKFPLETKGQSHSYRVVLHWPSGNNDTAYAGNQYGSAVTVKAIASQVPFGSTPVEPVEPEETDPVETDPIDPEETGTSDYHVIFDTYNLNHETSSDRHRYDFKITIQNNSTEDVKNWELDFNLEAVTQHHLYDALSKSFDENTGRFVYANPLNHNKEIVAGGTISFGGGYISLDGQVHTPEQVTVNGQPATVEVIRR